MATKQTTQHRSLPKVKGRLTVRFYESPMVAGFTPVDQMLIELVLSERAGKTANKVAHVALRLLHREMFRDRYESAEDPPELREAQRERDRAAIMAGYDVSTIEVATEVARRGLQDTGVPGHQTMADMLSKAGWQKGAKGEWTEPSSD